MKELINKKIAFLGLGIENLSFIKYLVKIKLNCQITICDPLNEKELKSRLGEIKESNNTKIELKLGKNYDKNLKKYDIIMRSPGYPLHSREILKIKNTKTKIDSTMSYFFKLSPTKNIIGVTGTKGKGTTASLIYEILKQAKKDVYLGGNIGIAPFDFMEKLNIKSYVVLELSSFQLEDMIISPRFSIITNLYQDHLAPADKKNPNHHKSLKEYWNAKLNIIKNQNSNCVAIVSDRIKSQDIKLETKANLIYYKKSDIESNLIGEHNKENIEAARIVADQLGIREGIIAKGVKNFKSLPHRLEFIAKINDIKYFDDSFATMPEATITAMHSFDKQIILLAGGSDKGSDFKELAKIIKSKVKFIILFSGEGSSRIKNELINIGFDTKKIKTVYNMQSAVNLAKEKAKINDIVLLSTACASFGIFKNYKERGNLFKKAVIS